VRNITLVQSLMTVKLVRVAAFTTKRIALGGRDAGISADQEEKTAGRGAFDPDKWNIDSDEAQKLTRQAEVRQRNENEDFIMAIEAIDGVPCWKVIRQCWIKGNRENCDSGNGYYTYVNIETGEATSEKNSRYE